jgi:lipopolysaccharide heptosyltransferase II
MPFSPEQVNSILVISLSNIGDCILTTPVISFLREQFPKARLDVVVGPKAISLFEPSQTSDHIICFDKKAPLAEMFRFIFHLRKAKYDLVIDLRNTLIPWFVRAQYRSRIRVDRSQTSMRMRHLARLQPYFDVTEAPNHFDFFSKEESDHAWQKFLTRTSKGNFEQFMVIAPGAGSATKRWTAAGFCEVMDHFVKQGKTIVLLGDGRERELVRNLMHAPRVVDLVGVLSLRESASLIYRSAVVIANDSALMHLAHELGRPVVSIFGPTSHDKYWQAAANRKLVRQNLACSPCEKAQCQIEYRKCLDDLPARDVIQAAEELMKDEVHVG